ncbi:MAG: error-prone DNA polymerase [Actinomycetota bacterium]|nr:error-prone DNA polymerase [Actinomycetota bacterium]
MPERPPGKSGPWPERKLPRPAPAVLTPREAGGYAELHCHTNFSFLDGASHPEDLVGEAVRLGLDALAVTDHDGLYGAVRMAEVARALGLPIVFGAEVTLDARRPSSGLPDPEGEHLIILAEGPIGYARLAKALSGAQMEGRKGAPRLSLDVLAGAARAPVHRHPQVSTANDTWFVLTGCRKGTVPKALVEDGPAAAARALHRLVDGFGVDRVLVELWDHYDPLDQSRNDALATIAARAGVGIVATNNVHYARPSERPLATALAAIRARRPMDALDPWLPAAASAHLRSPAEQVRRFARWPGAVERTVEVARACAFDLAMAAPCLPDFPIPPGHTEMSWLRELAWAGAARRYPPDHPQHAEARRRIAAELDTIEELGFAGYFLLVHDLVEFCRRENLYCQGRGSAANSAVCYALGVTKADAVGLGLLFERFLSPERDGPPDIDLDIEHERREEAIQYVYRRYGRDRAAQVANVITYRPRSALREMAKACGLSPGAADAVAKSVEGWTMREVRADAGDDGLAAIPPQVLDLAQQVQGFPRHLGIHSGGMVIADRPLTEYCPVEWAAMEDRSVLQWDKDDCAAAGLVKFDLLGLGMLTLLHLAVDLIAEHRGIEIDLATIPQDDAVYDMLCAADTVGIFQVESRAQMATLPRLRPRCFYDIVVEVALIRPGPIQGGSVHPYIRRRRGEEPVTYLHPLLEKSLKKTLGVPLFQEQLMQMAIDVAGFTPAEADLLRQAMGSKRSHERMARMHDRLLAGMAANGITGEVAAEIAHKLEAFADFGFPESHSVSFAYLVYASSWMKLHYPAEFTAALLNAQPMGFYSPHTIVRDARRHGVEVIGPDLLASRRDCTLERREDGNLAVRIGLRYVRNLGDALLERIEAERAAGGPFVSLEDFARRTGASTAACEALATAGAFGCFELSRRDALWAAAALREARPDKLPGLVTGVEAPALPGMTPVEEAAADLWSMGLSPTSHPTEFARPDLDAAGVTPIAGLADVAHRSVVEVAGVVTHRQRPGTAAGVIFINLEDETGLLNVICSPEVWRRHRRAGRHAPALVVRGVLERHQGVTNLVAQRLSPLPSRFLTRSRDFR